MPPVSIGIQRHNRIRPAIVVVAAPARVDRTGIGCPHVVFPGDKGLGSGPYLFAVVLHFHCRAPVSGSCASTKPGSRLFRVDLTGSPDRIWSVGKPAVENTGPPSRRFIESWREIRLCGCAARLAAYLRFTIGNGCHGCEALCSIPPRRQQNHLPELHLTNWLHPHHRQRLLRPIIPRRPIPSNPARPHPIIGIIDAGCGCHWPCFACWL